MTNKKQWVCYAVMVALLGVPVWAVWAAEATPSEAPKPATAPAGPKDLLDAIPEEAWGFAAIPNLKTFDGKLGDLGEKLNFPIGSPIALAMGQLGIGEGLREEGGVGLVVLDPTQYGAPPDMLVLLMPTTDAKALLSAFNPQDAGDGLQKIEILGRGLYVAPKGGFVVLGMDKTSVKFVADAKKGIRPTLKPELLERYGKSDIYAMINLRPAIEMAKPLAGQAVAMFMMGSMEDDPEAAERIQKTAQDVVNLLDELTTLEITLGLDQVGLQLSAYLSFSEGTITKRIATLKPTPAGLLAGLPKDAYMLILGIQGSDQPGNETVQQGLLDLLMSRPEIGKVLDKAKMGEIQKIANALRANIRDYNLSISLLPEGSDGMVCVTSVCQTTNVKASMETLQKLIEAYKGVGKGEQVTKALQGLTYKAGAEKVGDVSVDHILVDLQNITTQESAGADVMETVKKLVGKDGVLFRVAPAGDKHIVITLGGGTQRLEEVMKLASSGASPLSEDPGVMKVRPKLPKNRVLEAYLSADRILKVAKAVTGSDQVPVMPEIQAPLAVSLSAEKNHGRLDIVLPIELIVEIKNIVLQVMMGGGFGGGSSF